MSVACVGKTTGPGTMSAAHVCGRLWQAGQGESWLTGPQAAPVGGRASPFSKHVSAFAEPGLTLLVENDVRNPVRR